MLEESDSIAEEAAASGVEGRTRPQCSDGSMNERLEVLRSPCSASQQQGQLVFALHKDSAMLCEAISEGGGATQRVESRSEGRAAPDSVQRD